MEWIYDINIASVALRLTLSVLFGSLVGIERGANKHQAGLRTHVLVCLGATLAMMTNAYILQFVSQMTDPARLGSQVISGIGFLGAGLILVTSRNKVRGLTTAAGLWASACIGLALGIGFYSGALIAGLFVFIVLALLPGVEDRLYKFSRVVELFIEVDNIVNMRNLLSFIRKQDMTIIETLINRSAAIVSEGYSINISIRISKDTTHIEVIELLAQLPGVYLIEELD